MLEGRANEAKPLGRVMLVSVVRAADEVPEGASPSDEPVTVDEYATAEEGADVGSTRTGVCMVSTSGTITDSAVGTGVMVALAFSSGATTGTVCVVGLDTIRRGATTGVMGLFITARKAGCIATTACSTAGVAVGIGCVTDSCRASRWTRDTSWNGVKRGFFVRATITGAFMCFGC